MVCGVYFKEYPITHTNILTPVHCSDLGKTSPPGNTKQTSTKGLSLNIGLGGDCIQLLFVDIQPGNSLLDGPAHFGH